MLLAQATIGDRSVQKQAVAVQRWLRDSSSWLESEQIVFVCHSMFGSAFALIAMRKQRAAVF